MKATKTGDCIELQLDLSDLSADLSTALILEIEEKISDLTEQCHTGFSVSIAVDAELEGSQ